MFIIILEPDCSCYPDCTIVETTPDIESWTKV